MRFFILKPLKGHMFSSFEDMRAIMQKDDFKISYEQEENSVNNMVTCPYFNTKYIHLTEDLNQDLSKRDSFTIYMCVGGEVIIENEFGSEHIRKGETILITANCNTIVLKSRDAKLLEVTI